MAKKKELIPDNLLYYQRKYLINKIRQISMYWPYKNKAKNAIKVKVLIGLYKNGKPEYKMKYKCNSCAKLFDKIEMDHIESIVNTSDGFVDWTTYINRALCDDRGYQGLCRDCHNSKSNKELKKRAKSRKKIK